MDKDRYELTFTMNPESEILLEKENISDDVISFRITESSESKLVSICKTLRSILINRFHIWKAGGSKCFRYWLTNVTWIIKIYKLQITFTISQINYVEGTYILPRSEF